jgi:Fe-S-cluster containining protein
METRRLTVELGLPGGDVHIEMDVPMGEVPMGRLLPALRTTADAFVAFSAERSATEGKPVSCAKGCGACCRQAVPVAQTEARRIGTVLEELPEPRRSVVKERFAAALRRIEEAGLLPALDGRVAWGAGRAVEIGMEYFRLGIACPFLEDESCSIYEERPIACREYLVTSAPAHCAAPTPESVEAVPLPTRVWAAVAREEQGTADTDPARCVPLILAPRWASEHPEPEAQRPGPEVLRRIYARFSRDRSGEGPPG